MVRLNEAFENTLQGTQISRKINKLLERRGL